MTDAPKDRRSLLAVARSSGLKTTHASDACGFHAPLLRAALADAGDMTAKQRVRSQPACSAAQQGVRCPRVGHVSP